MDYIKLTQGKSSVVGDDNVKKYHNFLDNWTEFVENEYKKFMH